MKQSAIFIGNESLTQQCAEKWLNAGNTIAFMISRNTALVEWAKLHSITVVSPQQNLAQVLAGVKADWLLSIANLDILDDDVLALANRGALNFHDGPLPRYAGLNAPVWARINGEEKHGITWHLIESGVDTGAILSQTMFDILPSDTALTLNTKAYEAALASFDDVIKSLKQDPLLVTPQNRDDREYFGKLKRPSAFGMLDFSAPVDATLALVRGLDHGTYWNPLAVPRFEFRGQVFFVEGASETDLPNTGLKHGTVLDVSEAALTISTASAPIRLTGLKDSLRKPVSLIECFSAGDALDALSEEERRVLDEAQRVCAKGDAHWRAALGVFSPARLELSQAADSDPILQQIALDVPAEMMLDSFFERVSGLVAGLSETGSVDLAFAAMNAPKAAGHISDWVPIRYGDTFAEDLKMARQFPVFAVDIAIRDANLVVPVLPDIGLSEVGPIDGCAITITSEALHFDSNRVSRTLAKIWAERIAHCLHLDSLSNSPADWPLLPQHERELVLNHWNETAAAFDQEVCVHQFFESQAARTPDADALVFEGEVLSYAELNEQANRAAHVLVEMGVTPGVFVGLAVHRGPQLLIGALAILKAGGAYVPIDPGYPADRIALYLHDSAASIVVTETSLASNLPSGRAELLKLDADPRLENAANTNPKVDVSGNDLAYLIYTSGSTGKPKGVMVEHRNVSNFFTGMDERLEQKEGGVWLAVTSLSFDISVLELFYTLGRGFKLVLAGDESRTLVSGGRVAMTGKGMDFGLFYWGNDDGPGRQKYHLLLEGAKFADAHGFSSVWTPERHFHAFGGPYPNPSVTGAAVAAVTENISVRSGSCVAPLHHPLRIAEEWAVIDNLTDGRAGLSVAAGWQPDDFVLNPDNAPPANKAAMFETLETLRKLWRGEAVKFPNGAGRDVDVVTQPRPISKELPVWVTTAGNPDTWREAGENGANVLTHLLGQSIEEVGGKIAIYREALTKAGYDSEAFTVTLMLHTYVASSREEARNISRQPMKDYLNAAAGLIKQYAWAFPAFKKPKGVENPFQLDLDILDEAELDAILEFAFERYFEDSGLFGTVEDCLDRVEQLKRIGVDEIGCLIDYGIAPEVVLEGLKPLAEVHRRSNVLGSVDDGDYSIAAQIVRHDVTHLQCTPSLVRMLVQDEESRMALSRIKTLMIGGEALPGDLVKELSGLTDARIENMYGPTETTIWSCTETASSDQAIVNIGKPIANTQTYVLNEHGAPCAIGVAGELFIGGAGVTRGYWQRQKMTEERFVDNPYHGGRMYRTGDLARWRDDGKLDFLGRADTQVKLRGFRIELGEIEARLHDIGDIRQAVVIAREDSPADVRLVAYLVMETTPDEAAIRASLSQGLPDFMIPQHFVRLDAIPLTPNKKVDRKALPSPLAQRSDEKLQPAVPQQSDNTIEAEIAKIWSGVLGVERISGQDNFFDLGGHSLLAVQAHREIREACTVPRLSITDIFRFPTLAGLAGRVQVLGAPAASKVKVSPEKAAKHDQGLSSGEAISRRRQMRARREMARAS